MTLLKRAAQEEAQVARRTAADNADAMGVALTYKGPIYTVLREHINRVTKMEFLQRERSDYRLLMFVKHIFTRWMRFLRIARLQ